MKIFDNEFLENKRINTLPFRSHYIPFNKEDKPKYFHGAIIKESSSKLISLNGEWDFKEHKDYRDLNNLDEALLDKINVPSCVQCFEYDFIQYLNCRYPFPFNPPYIDRVNPCFHYRKHIHINKKDRYYLVFEGVDNAFYLFINNQKVGYSLIAHSKSEFDVTDYLIDGDNKIDVIVLKWSASSYFECQDKFRFSGIFRDVYLLNRKESHIFDYQIFSTYKGNVGYINFLNKSDVDIEIRLNRHKYIAKANEEIRIKIDKPILWNEYHPYLYKLTLHHDDEYIYEYIGIRKVSIENGVFKLNDKHIKFRGVNRHESHPEKGMTVSLYDTYQDLKLMKSLNINAIRTSHYPDIPEFYELCNHMGIYVLDEADVETHGASQYRGEYNLQDWEDFANKKENIEPIYDREVSLFERDKNKTCVLIFSLGNESSYGIMFNKGLDYLKSHSDRPIHYEGVWNTTDYDKNYFDKRIDFASRMYPSPKELKEKHLDDKRETRPIIMCEYSHAMGNSNGDLKDYWKLFNSSDRFCGGFIWEWCDHAVNVNGELHYGGDDSDEIHDGNFCVDGLVTPYRKLKSNTLEMKAIYGGKYIEDTPIDKTKEFKGTITNKKLDIEIDEKSLSIKEIRLDNQSILSIEGLTINYLRAHIDNDNGEMDSENLLKEAHLIFDKVIDNTYFGHLENKEKLIDFKVSYKVNKNVLEVSLNYEILKDDLFVPRIGSRFAMKGVHYFTFYGYGPGESYIDKNVYTSMGEHRFSIYKNMANNLKPQECGSHYYSSYIKTSRLDISADKPFSFSILPYSLEELESHKHNYELRPTGIAYFSLDIAMAGVGTHSCGPRLDEKYWVPRKGSNTFKIYFKK